MNVKVFYFSPVGNTEKIAFYLGEALAKGLGGSVCNQSFTLPQQRQGPLAFSAEDLVVIALPVYAGRLPNVLLKFLQTIEANGALCVPVVVFGNRNFDEALMELSLLLQQAGGQVIGGGAFVAQHAFSKILGQGRPDARDFAELDQFARAILDKVQAGSLEMTAVIPGSNPVGPYYTPRDRHGVGIDIRKVKPKVGDRCSNCGLCATVCPMGSISLENVKEVQGICIKCCACEKRCPQGARYFDDPGYCYHRSELEEVYTRRADPQWFV